MKLRSTRLTAVSNAVKYLYKGPNLNLDFTKDQPLDPRITFSRASNATVTGPDGTLGYAPHNLLTFSEQFDNAVWTKNRVTVAANAARAPDGTATADKLVETVDNGSHNAARLGFAFTAGFVNTLSFFAKAGERSRIQLRTSNLAFPTVTVIFNLATGEVVTSSGATARISPESGGFYRCAATFTATSTASDNLQIDICRDDNSFVYTGDGTSGLFIWGAQLNVGPLQPYYPTTVKNLLGYTQEFDNAAWTKSNATVTANAVVAPDGSMTADKLVENTATTSHRVEVGSAVISAGVQTLSVYLKSAGKTAAQVQLDGTVAGVGSGVSISVDLASATFSANASSGNLSFVAGAVLPVGNDWYRVSLTFASTAASTGTVRFYIQNPYLVTTYTGDGTSGIYIWGAQLSDSASLNPYVYNPGAAPTAAAYYGPRFDYDPVTLTPRGLLIEEQRTNSIRNNTMQGAVAGTPGTLPTNWQKAELSGLTIAVEGVGFGAGVSYVDLRVSGTATATSSSSIQFEQNSAVAASSGQTWNLSSYIQVIAGSAAGLSATRLGWEERSGGFLASIQGNVTPQVGGLLARSRVSFTGTNANASTAFIKPFFNFTPVNGAVIDVTFRVGMPQLELGAFATSVIPTSGAAATRAADVAVMTGANFSNWYRQDEGTLFAEFSYAAAVAAQNFIVQSTGDSGNYVAMYRDSSNQRLTSRVRNGGVDQAFMYTTASAVVPDTVYKQALAYKTDDFASAANGATPTTDTSGSPPSGMTALGIGGATYTSSVQLNGHIRKIAYFPRRLSNAELQGITS